MKTLTFEIKRELELAVIDVPSHQELVLAYVRMSDAPSKWERDFMWREDLEKLARRKKPLRGIEDVKWATLPTPHLKAYPARVTAVTREFIEELDSSGRINFDYRSDLDWKKVWGERLPEGAQVVAVSFGDYTILNVDGSYRVHPVFHTFSETMGYDAFGIAEAARCGKLPGVRVQKHSRHDIEPGTYYVPGNGYSVDMSIDMSEEEFMTWRTALGSYERELLLRERFKDFFREESSVEDEDED